MPDFRPYVVRQGDHVPGLAGRFGFDPDDVWNHAKNADLKKARGDDRHVLLPGDVLYIPDEKPQWLPVTLGSTNAFKVPSNLVSVVVQFMEGGQPLAGEAYVVDGAEIDPGSLDGQGFFRAQVPARVASIIVHFPGRNEEYTVKVGHLDPPDSLSGIRMRLGALGIYGRTSCSDGEGDLTFGLRQFQRAQGLDITGDLDDATTSKLTEVFGR